MLYSAFPKKSYILLLLVVILVILPFFFFHINTTKAASQIPTTGNIIGFGRISSSSTISKKHLVRFSIDNNDQTFWQSKPRDNQWLKIDMRKQMPIGKVSIVWVANTTKSYDLQISNNNLSWTTFAKGATDGTESQILSHAIDRNVRYIRIVTRSRHTTDRGNAIREIGLYKSLITPTATISSSKTPTLTPTPKVSVQSQNNFVTVCGTGLCLNSRPYVIHSATMYGQMDNPDAQIQNAIDAKLNAVELVEYEVNWRDLSSSMAEDTWARNDRFIAKAQEKGIKVILHLSSYGHALAKAGIKPTTHDWNPFLSFVMNRKNTITGLKYADDPTIIKIQLYGEIDAPNYDKPWRGTTQETTDFFKRTLAQLRALDKNHVISSGGFSYINDQHSGIDWKTIMADPNNQVCDVEINSFGDRNVSMPNVASYCKSIGKPWFLSAWSSCQGTKHYADDASHWPSDNEMALHAEDMYKITRNSNPVSPTPAMAAIGTSFWNLGNTTARIDNCDIGTQYPLTLDVVKRYAP